MSTKVPFQVGSWVTIRPSSSSNRDRRDARTPALITAVNIEGAGSATVVYPNPLVLQHGFKGKGWKRLADVPFKELRHFTATVTHETQLLRALRLGRTEPRSGTTVELPDAQHQASSAGEQTDEGKPEANLRKWMKPGSIWDSAAADLARPSDFPAPDLESKPGLRKWMRPGSVWDSEAPAEVSEPSVNTVPPAVTEDCGVTLDECTASNHEPALRAEENSVENEKATAVPGDEQHFAAADSLLHADLSPSEPAAKRAKVIHAAVQEPEAGAEELLEKAAAQSIESISTPMSSESEPQPQPPSPQPSSRLASLFAEEVALTPSPQKPSGIRRTPSPQRLSTDGNILAFTAAVARAFSSKKTSHISRNELLDQIFPNPTEKNLSTFNLNLSMLDQMDKVCVIDDVVFSLA